LIRATTISGSHCETPSASSRSQAGAYRPLRQPRCSGSAWPPMGIRPCRRSGVVGDADDHELARAGRLPASVGRDRARLSARRCPRRSRGAAPQPCCSAEGRPVSCLSSCLIHPRPGPFTRVRSDGVCAVRGRWRTPVNAGQHCWKACWVQALASSNLASSAATLTWDNAPSSRAPVVLIPRFVSVFVHESPRKGGVRTPDKRAPWRSGLAGRSATGRISAC